jgi:hypothetical protein
MRHGTALAAVVCLLASIVCTAARADGRSAARPHRCPHTRPLLANGQAEIYEAHEAPGTGFVHACAFGTGRVTRLGSVAECSSGVCAGIEHETLSGSLVAYDSFSTAVGLRGEWYVQVRDLRTRRLLRKVPTGAPLQKLPGSVGLGPATGVVVTRSGGVAWIAWDLQRSQPATGATPARRFYDVYACDVAGTRLLAAGPDVDPSSLALAGHTLYWVQSGKPLSAALQ